MPLHLPCEILDTDRYPSLVRDFLPAELVAFGTGAPTEAGHAIFAIGIDFERPDEGEKRPERHSRMRLCRFPEPGDIEEYDPLMCGGAAARHRIRYADTEARRAVAVARALAAVALQPRLESLADDLGEDMSRFSLYFLRHAIVVAHADTWREAARWLSGTTWTPKAAHRGLRLFLDATLSGHTRLAAIADMRAFAISLHTADRAQDAALPGLGDGLDVFPATD